MTTRTWLDRLAHELAVEGVDAERVASIVVEAEGHLEETGESPLAAFGEPETYAREVAHSIAAPRPAPAVEGPRRLRVTGVSKAYGGRTVLRDVSLEARGGAVVVLVGDNGVGKTTLLRILAGLSAPDRGEVELSGSVGYAPQDGGVLPHLRPDEHFALFGRGRGLSRRAATRAGRVVAEQLGWDARTAPIAAQLSGGTRQKLNVALAALGDPDVLLLDEPYQGLDRESTERFWDLLAAWRDAGRAVLVVSHALEAIRHADEVVELTSTGRRSS